MTWLEPVTLSNSRICLELLDQRHHDELVEATNDGELWKLWYTSVPRPDDVAAEIERRLELCRQHSMLPFAIVEQSSGRAVGMTTFMNADAANRRIEIGSTWFRRSTQRTGLNTHCKLLMLTHAFETLDCIAVAILYSFFQPPEPSRHRTSGSETGWHPAQPSASGRRQSARHVRLFHHRRRMAGRESTPDVSGGTNSLRLLHGPRSRR